MICLHRVLVLSFAFISSVVHAQIVNNPSFEGPPAMSVPPPGWTSCGDYSTPDTHPINDAGVGWNFSKKAIDGNTYLGLVMRGSIGGVNDNLTEAAGTKLITPIKKNSCYTVTIFLSTFLGAEFNTGFDLIKYDTPGRLIIWGSTMACGKQQMIWSSPIISNEEWVPFSFQFSNTANKDFDYLVLEAAYANPSEKKYGNVLIDNIEIKNERLTLGEDKVFCEGKETILTAPSNIDAVSWSNNSTEPTISVLKKGTYWAKLTKGNCSLIDSIIVNSVKPLGKILGMDTSLCLGNELIIDATTPYSTYYWNTGSRDSKILVSKSGIYQVAVINVCGEVNGSVNVSYRDPCCQISAPNVFTPNADTYNDFFEITTLSSVQTYDLQIVNRWGGLVFSSNELQKFWDGKNKGIDVSTGVYFWIAKIGCRNGNENLQNKFQGMVSVVR